MIYLYGAGGHAKVIIDILETLNLPIAGIVDDNEQLHEVLGYPVYRREWLDNVAAEDHLLITIGYNEIRKRIAESMKLVFLPPVIHPSAIISKYAQIGEGTVIIHGAILQAEAMIGRHCIVNTGATVGHECKIGDYVHIASNATLCGNVSVGEGTWIGAGSVVKPGIKIGANCMIGVGSVVVKDIPDNVVVVGNPARIIRNK